MLSIYEQYGFKFFLCKSDKSPDTRGDWRAEENQITREQAEELQSIGRMIGAWIPEDVIVIDLDRHEGKPDGVKSFKEIKEQYGIHFDLMDNTLVVQTAGNGLHVFFTTGGAHSFRQGPKAPGIDLKTHSGYVIAAGSPGYRALTDYEPCTLPEELSLWLESCQTSTRHNPEDDNGGPCGSGSSSRGAALLPVKLLRGILKKVPVANFRENVRWQQFITSVVAACGNGTDVHEALDAWSRSDPEYAGDRSVSKRIQSFEQMGGITIGTFVHFLREENLSQHIISQVVKYDSITNILTEAEERETALPFPEPDYDALSDTPEAIEFFNIRGNTAAATLLQKALRGVIMFVEGEKRNYFFNGSRWERLSDMYSVVYTVLFRTAKILYAKADSTKEANDRLMKIIASINERFWKKSVIDEFNVRDGIFREFVDWDSPSIKETLTTIDGVIDFRDGQITPRSGLQNEFRKKHVPFYTTEILSASDPVRFGGFLEEIFPDEETRRTAVYSMALFISGNAGKRRFQIWEGSGSNGKSTLIEILKSVLGRGKAITYKPELLLSTKFDNSSGATPELAEFQGAYAAFGVEVDAGKKFSMGRIKNLTGGDSISARALYQNQITFEATWQLVIAVNDLPSFNGDDKAFINRLLILPFEMKYVKDEEERLDHLRNGIQEKFIQPAKERDTLQRDILIEQAGILRFLIEKYVYLQTHLAGIVPESNLCRRKKAEYIKDNDDMGMFMKEFCEVETERGFFSSSEEIADAYREFVGNKKLSTTFIVRLIKKYDERVESEIKKIKVYDEYNNGKFKSTRGLANIRLREQIEEFVTSGSAAPSASTPVATSEYTSDPDEGEDQEEIPF